MICEICNEEMIEFTNVQYDDGYGDACKDTIWICEGCQIVLHEDTDGDIVEKYKFPIGSGL